MPDRVSQVPSSTLRFHKVERLTSSARRRIEQARAQRRAKNLDEEVVDRISQITEEIVEEVTKKTATPYREKMPSNTEIHVHVGPPSSRRRGRLRESIHEALATPKNRTKTMLGIIVAIGGICGAIKAIFELMKVIH